MKALSVRQPWASMIARGEKTIELRTWRTHHRGPLLICASAKIDRENPRLPVGVAVCIVDVVDCRGVGYESVDPAADSRAACCVLDPGDDYWGFVLANARPAPPIPVKGKLGLFEVDLSI